MHKNRIAPNDVYQGFLLKLKTLTEEELNGYIVQAKKLGLTDEQINQGIKTLNALKNNN